jgi:hypothetical protein
MANHVNNNLRVDTISPEGQKVWNSFIERIEALKEDGSQGHLTGLFYKADEAGYWIVPEGAHASEAVGAKWAFAYDMDEEFVNIESAWSPVIPLAEHIAIEIGHVDPDVRLILTYEDEGPNFVGVTTFDADGINTFNDLDWDDLRETVIHNHEEIRERWDAEECDWHEGQEDEGEDMMSEVIWETASDWQHENIEWS